MRAISTGAGRTLFAVLHRHRLVNYYFLFPAGRQPILFC